MKINSNDKRAYLGTLFFMAYDCDFDDENVPQIEVHKRITNFLRIASNEYIEEQLKLIENAGLPIDSVVEMISLFSEKK